MARIIVPAAEVLLEKEEKVLNMGFVRLIDYMGGDARIVQSARVSYGEGTKTVRQDRNLLDYLMREEHTSPFEQVNITFHTKMPIFVARQWVRHRTARLNEISGRYSILKDEFYVPSPEDIRYQAKRNKQGGDEPLPIDEAEKIISKFETDQASLYSNYMATIDLGVAREMARINLPLSLYTEWYWNMDLHNLFHFLKLRVDRHAQPEIRVYGQALGLIAKAVAPMAWEAFEEHLLYAVKVSRRERFALERMFKGEPLGLAEREEQILMAKFDTNGVPRPNEDIDPTFTPVPIADPQS